MEDALYEITSMRLLAELSLNNAIPDHTTIMNFRHLLEKHKLSRQLFKEVNKWLSSAGIYLKKARLLTPPSLKRPAQPRIKQKHATPRCTRHKR